MPRLPQNLPTRKTKTKTPAVRPSLNYLASAEVQVGLRVIPVASKHRTWTTLPSLAPRSAGEEEAGRQVVVGEVASEVGLGMVPGLNRTEYR